jgi:eukaryotic-like serine/threonine-protein kinase
MSEVRRGEDVLLGRSVAIKLLLDYADSRSVARFQQEAQILARLQHPNVITVFDTGVDGGDRFIVMELVDGPTLRELLDAEGRLAPERAGEIAGRLASALGFAHGKAVIHRDVKPSNVLLPPDGGVKLADMGIARLLSPEALTATLSVRGTALYIAPEQLRGDRVDSRADLYSLGCVLFEMLTGRTPFEGDLAALSYAHTNTPAPRVRSIDPAVPAAMDELVAALLEKDPADRPQTGDDVRKSLEAAMRQVAVTQTVPMEPVTPAPTHRPPEAERVMPPGVAPTADFQPGPLARTVGARLRPRPWSTLPGRIAILLTAVGGLIAALYATGVIGPRATEGPTAGSPSIAGRATTGPSTTEPTTIEPSTPQLLRPLPNQVIPQNDSTIGCSFHPSFGFGFGVVFDWTDSSSDGGIEGYEIFAEHETATSPLVSTFVTDSQLTLSRCNTFITDTNLEEWRWRVRARDVSGRFGAWSPFAFFSFEPCRVDGTPCST